MKYRRLLALLLLMLICLQSCGRIIIEDISSMNTERPENEAPETEYLPEDADADDFDRYSGNVGKGQAQKYLDELTGTDCGGASVYIASADNELIFPDDGAIELSRFAIERNAAVEELINAKLVVTSESISALSKQLKQSQLAGKERYDVLSLPLNEVGRLAVDGLLLDIKTETDIDISKIYFNQSSAEATSFGGAVYGIAGDASLIPTEFPALFMNTELLRDAGISADRIYSAVLKGEWTWDEFLVCTETVGALEQYNTVTSQSMADIFDEAVFISSGRSYLEINEQGETVVGYDPDSAAAAVTRLNSIMTDPGANISSERNSIGDFASGRTAFAFEYLYVMSWLVNSQASWGVIPVPKNSEKGNYRSIMSEDTPVFAVPTVCCDAETATVVITAINAASEGYIYEPFVQNTLINVLHNNDSANMLDVIFDSAVLDRAVTYDDRFPSLEAITALIGNSVGNEDWAETYATVAEEANMILADELPIYVVEEEEPPETEPPETEPAETTAPETKPAETAAPETKPAETTASETKPAETTAPETEPAETTAPETKPAETTAPETKPAETTASETKPAETTAP